MLNDQKLGEILKLIHDIHWKTQDSDESSLLFYRIGDDDKALDTFNSRIKDSKFSWLVINKMVSGLPANSVVVPENEWPMLQKKVLDVLYPQPKLKLIALTGTNGKTTTADLVLQLGEQLGKKGFSIGTLGVRELNHTVLDFGLTSPSLIDLRKFLHKYGAKKDFCVMEASSHALTQDRYHGLTFDGIGWPSFSQDHLDYHKTMEVYFEAKCLILKQLAPSAKVFIPLEQETLFQKVLKVTDRARKAPSLPPSLPLFFKAQFNRNNLEVAAALVEDVFQTKLTAHFDKLTPPDGRFYIRPYRSNFVVVDFAHTPDALDNICQGIKVAFPNHKLKVLFGCGGDRDRGKRPLMGTVVEKWANKIYVTSDNPRSEDPEQIIQDIVKGFSKQNYQKITNRPEAVKVAMDELAENEVLLLAGKGHEDYILIKGVKHPYSDIKEVETYLSRIKS